MKLLLLGANGQVGFELKRAVGGLADLVCATRDGTLAGGGACVRADVSQAVSLIDVLQDHAPDIVVNAAAYTGVDRAEEEPDLADRINHRALAVLGAWAASNDRLVVHYSTDYVFDGTATRPYREDDATAPLGVYGQTKLAGEIALRESGCAHLVLRTAWVYAARGHNFLRTMLRVGSQRDALNVVDDQRGSPTTARLIARASAEVLAAWSAAAAGERERLLGTYHLSAAGECSWYEFAQAIFARAAAANLVTRVPTITPVPSAEYPTRARRPACSVLDTTKIRRTFALDLPPWQAGLEQVIGELAAASTNPDTRQ